MCSPARTARPSPAGPACSRRKISPRGRPAKPALRSGRQFHGNLRPGPVGVDNERLLVAQVEVRAQPAELFPRIADQLRARARQRTQATDGDPGLPDEVVTRLYPVDHQLQELARWHPEVPRAQLGRDELADLGPVRPAA
ncbi:MAG TPA: hypothetical protein VGG35_27325 [Streptosporangiaceae bacterium]|jgi:hypothetical protein